MSDPPILIPPADIPPESLEAPQTHRATLIVSAVEELVQHSPPPIDSSEHTPDVGRGRRAQNDVESAMVEERVTQALKQ